MFNCCSHGTLLHFGLQSSRLNICYYHQDLHLRRLHPGPRPRLRGAPQRPSYSSRPSPRGHRTAGDGRINQHLFWALMSVGIGRLNPAFGSSRSASSAYQKWPTEHSHSTARLHASEPAPLPIETAPGAGGPGPRTPARNAALRGRRPPRGATPPATAPPTGGEEGAAAVLSLGPGIRRDLLPGGSNTRRPLARRRATCPPEAFPADPEPVAAHRRGGNAPGQGRPPAGRRSPHRPAPPGPPPRTELRRRTGRRGRPADGRLFLPPCRPSRPAPTAAPAGARAPGDEEGRTGGRGAENGRPHPVSENRKGSAAETAPKDAGRAARGGLGGDRDERTTAPSRAGDRDRGGPAKEEGVTTPVPRPSRPTRARQHGTVPAGYPPADSRPHGGEARGRGPRLAPPLGPLSLSALGGARSTPSLSRSLPGRRHRTAARPRRGRAPPQRLAPGAGSYGALPESAFRGTKALRGRPRPRRRPPGRRERIEAAEGNRSPRRAPTAFPPGTGRPPPPPPTAGNGPARRPQPRRRGGPRTAIDRQATLRQAETPPRVPFFGGGPGARARPGLRAEGQHGARRTAGGTAARPTSIARDDTHAHAAGGTTAVGPRTRRLPFAAPRRGRLSPAALQRSRRHAPTTAPPARPPREPLPSERPATGGRTPSPVPEADATETRAGAAGARGRPGGGPAAAAAALPGPPQPRRAVGAPSPGHAPGGRRTAPSRGATPARRAPTRRPGGEAPPRLPARPPFGPHAAGKGDGNATGEARAGTADGAGGRRPAGRPRPPGREGGTLAERRRRRSARGRPRSRASADGGTAERSPQTGRGGGRAGDVRRTAPPVRSRRRPSRGEARPRQGESGQGESAAGAGGRNPAAEERQRARALCRHRPGFEGSGSAGPAARPRAAASPPRPGRREGGAGRPSPARRGYPPPARAAETTAAAGARPVATDTTAGDRRERLPTPQWRRATARRTPAAAGTTAAAAAGRAEPPESLNRRPARRAPFGPRGV
ncbi:basic proline-rich protein-like [Passer domesticus]|uniref:basic proline-rich protein-like n=1 Tax=Passer domesticus TaxID=48849 RepID=UPI0030FEE2D7